MYVCVVLFAICLLGASFGLKQTTATTKQAGPNRTPHNRAASKVPSLGTTKGDAGRAAGCMGMGVYISISRWHARVRIQQPTAAKAQFGFGYRAVSV